ncbi:unnamed protein product [Porites evermanni]|uniref:Platelet-derived growth factor (PDGF) family profile domain-containing protein n=1 Tax=Porites evermanni TaxID=104178 RepID=A0ABN8LU84_9CNID|nr:unnamed protein product [Porites evermanni]
MLFNILLFPLLLVQAASPQAKAYPQGLTKFFEKRGFPFGDAKFDPEVAISIQQQDESVPLKPVLIDVPEHSAGLNISVDTAPKPLKEAYCQPRPAAIKVPNDKIYFNHPSFVTLHRCSGGCPTAQNDYHCTVSAETQISVEVLKIQGNSKVGTIVTMYNHTHCSCDCIKSSSACDPVKRVWDVGSCSCKCRSDLSACESNQRRNAATCDCECAETPSSCTGYHMTWNYTNCGCSCSQSAKEYCQGNIDLSTCQCITPDIQALI